MINSFKIKYYGIIQEIYIYINTTFVNIKNKYFSTRKKNFNDLKDFIFYI